MTVKSDSEERTARCLQRRDLRTLSSYAGSSGEVQAHDESICSQRRGRNYDCMVLNGDSLGAALEFDHVHLYEVLHLLFFLLFTGISRTAGA
jgi:hypothetical protein